MIKYVQIKNKKEKLNCKYCNYYSDNIYNLNVLCYNYLQ